MKALSGAAAEGVILLSPAAAPDGGKQRDIFERPPIDQNLSGSPQSLQLNPCRTTTCNGLESFGRLFAIAGIRVARRLCAARAARRLTVLVGQLGASGV